MMAAGFEWDVTKMMDKNTFVVVLCDGFDPSLVTHHATNCTCNCW